MNLDKINFNPVKQAKEALAIRGLPEGCLEKLDALAAANGTSRENLVRKVILEVLESS
jgi:plasmid stability protein